MFVDIVGTFCCYRNLAIRIGTRPHVLFTLKCSSTCCTRYIFAIVTSVKMVIINKHTAAVETQFFLVCPTVTTTNSLFLVCLWRGLVHIVFFRTFLAHNNTFCLGGNTATRQHIVDWILAIPAIMIACLTLMTSPAHLMGTFFAIFEKFTKFKSSNSFLTPSA